MAPLLKWARGFLRRTPWTPLRFPTTGFEVIPTSEPLEEEWEETFDTDNYFTVNIGDLFASNTYQVVGKLGYGSTSTVWLARNLP
jgi:serine/threonine-protein kinase SRPK3